MGDPELELAIGPVLRGGVSLDDRDVAPLEQTAHPDVVHYRRGRQDLPSHRGEELGRRDVGRHLRLTDSNRRTGSSRIVPLGQHERGGRAPVAVAGIAELAHHVERTLEGLRLLRGGLVRPVSHGPGHELP